MIRWAPLLLAATLLGACAAPAPMTSTGEREAAYAERSEQLASWERWGLTGRLGVDGGEEGGSGRLDWNDSGEASSLQFRGALGQGAWRLDISPGITRLERSDGSIAEAADVDRLVWEETGWTLPVTALEWWVRGLAAPDRQAPERMELNPDGTIALLEQAGWRITFERYMDWADQSLPSRLEAVRDQLTVKLAVSRWRGGPGDVVAGPGSG